MKRFPLLWSCAVANLLHHRLALLLGSVVLTMAPMPAGGQNSVTFKGAMSYLPFTGLAGPTGIGVDSMGDVFVYDQTNLQVVELPKISAGYGPQVIIRTGASNPGYPAGLALDGAGDVLITDDNNSDCPLVCGEVFRIPRTTNGYGSPIVSAVYSFNPDESADPVLPTGIGIDSKGNVFVGIDQGDSGPIVQLSAFGTDVGAAPYCFDGPPYCLTGGVAVDGEGNIFFDEESTLDDNSPPPGIQELPWTGSGYGTQTTLTNVTVGLPGSPFLLALDSARNLYIGGGFELPWTGSGYGTPVMLLAKGVGIALDRNGNYYITQPQNGGAAGAVVEVQRGSVDFGNEQVCPSGQTSPACSITLPFSYTINSAVTLGTPVVLTDGKPDLDYTLAGGSTCTGALAAGMTCVVNVTFAPEAFGTRNGSVAIIDSSGKVLATTPIYGHGNEAAVQVSPSSLQFGVIPFGSTETLSLTVTNGGQGTLAVTPSIDAKSFTVTGNTCTVALTAGNSCTLELEFSPLSVGKHNGTLTLQTNTTISPAISLTGVASGVLYSSGVLDFGTVPYGSKATQVLTITNFEVPGTVTMSASAGPGGSYSILTNTQNTCQTGIQAGQSCTLPVQFSPESVGEHKGILTLTPSPGVVATAGLTGSSSGLEVNVPVLQFGNVPVNQSLDGGLAVTDLGLGRVKVEITQLVGKDFHLSPACIGYVNNGDICDLPVLFVPTTVGHHYDVVTLTPSVGAEPTMVGLEGAGVPLQETLSLYGAEITLPTTGLNSADGIAADRAGDVFIADSGNNRIVELPWAGTGYGAQVILATSGLNFPNGIVIDKKGNLLISDSGNSRIVELPKTGSGYGTQAILPMTGLSSYFDVALDGSNDVFVLNETNGQVLEWSWTGSAYGTPQTLTTVDLTTAPDGIAVDSAQNIFITGRFTQEIAELPWTGTGYGALIQLPMEAAYRVQPKGIAVDSARNLFIVEYSNVLKMTWTGAGYGPAKVLPMSLTSPQSVAVNGPGNVFISEGNSATEWQTQSVNFGSVYACAAGQKTPAPCNVTLTLNYIGDANVKIELPQLVNGSPDHDFTILGTRCVSLIREGATCPLEIKFAPEAAGVRTGTVKFFDLHGDLLLTTDIFGIGVSP
jgi:hypothetical protein